MPSSCAAFESESDVDDEIGPEPFLHIVASALELPLPKTRAACSIFDVARRAAVTAPQRRASYLKSRLRRR